jgi:anti-anti-sigma factor
MALSVAYQGSPPQLLDSEIRTVGSHALVALAGELDLSSVGLVYEQLRTITNDGVCHVALNMAEVTFADSTALSLLVSEHKRVESLGGELIIFAPSHELRRLFEITGLHNYLNVRPKTMPSEQLIRSGSEPDPVG